MTTADRSSIVRAFAPSSSGQLHYASTGSADSPTVLMLHQTPRSWREYAAVLPLLGNSYRALAIDTPGFGDSSRPAGAASISNWAAAVVELLDHLGIRQTHVVGHHTGGVIAVEFAATHPDRVRGLVLSSTPFTGPGFRQVRAERPPIDEVEAASDGSHLTELWQKRQGFYPPGRPDLLLAFVRDALVVIDDVEAGHTAVATYRMEDTIASVVARTLLIRATDDPFAFSHGDELRSELVNAASVEMVDIEGGMVPLPDQLPDEFATVVASFVGRVEVVLGAAQ